MRIKALVNWGSSWAACTYASEWKIIWIRHSPHRGGGREGKEEEKWLFQDRKQMEMGSTLLCQTMLEKVLNTTPTLLQGYSLSIKRKPAPQHLFFPFAPSHPSKPLCNFAGFAASWSLRSEEAGVSGQLLGRFGKDQLFIILLALWNVDKSTLQSGLFVAFYVAHFGTCHSMYFCRIKNNLKEALNNESL